MITLSTTIACIAMALIAGIGVGAAVFAIINEMKEHGLRFKPIKN